MIYILTQSNCVCSRGSASEAFSSASVIGQFETRLLARTTTFTSPSLGPTGRRSGDLRASEVVDLRRLAHWRVETLSRGQLSLGRYHERPAFPWFSLLRRRRTFTRISVTYRSIRYREMSFQVRGNVATNGDHLYRHPLCAFHCARCARNPSRIPHHSSDVHITVGAVDSNDAELPSSDRNTPSWGTTRPGVPTVPEALYAAKVPMLPY